MSQYKVIYILPDVCMSDNEVTHMCETQGYSLGKQNEMNYNEVTLLLSSANPLLLRLTDFDRVDTEITLSLL